MSTLSIVPWTTRWAPAFRALNEAWIRAMFEIETEDERLFADPYGTIVEPGGQIYFAITGGEAVGTAAILVHAESQASGTDELANDRPAMELAKMAVDPFHQGLGLSRLLMRACLGYARQQRASRVTLVTNSQLEPAVGLYRSFGFSGSPKGNLHGWARGDLAMQLEIT